MASIKHSFRVMSYNIWYEGYYPKEIAKQGIFHSSDRYKNIGQLCAQSQCDLIALQEVSEDAYLTIKPFLPDYYVLFQKHPTRSEGVMLLANRKVFELKNHESFAIEGGDNKGAVLFELLHRASQKTVRIATSHFKGGRERQTGRDEADYVARKLTAKPADVYLLAGDFNQGATEHDRDDRVVRLDKLYSLKDTPEKPYPTEPVNNRTIDYILGRGPCMLNPVGRKEVQPFIDARVSDHCPRIEEATIEGQQLPHPTSASRGSNAPRGSNVPPHHAPNPSAAGVGRPQPNDIPDVDPLELEFKEEAPPRIQPQPRSNISSLAPFEQRKVPSTNPIHRLPPPTPKRGWFVAFFDSLWKNISSFLRACWRCCGLAA